MDKLQLKEALNLQVDNANLKLGEIFVSLEYITGEQLFSLMQSYMKETDAQITEFQEWLSQDQVDDLVKKLKNQVS